MSHAGSPIRVLGGVVLLSLAASCEAGRESAQPLEVPGGASTSTSDGESESSSAGEAGDAGHSNESTDADDHHGDGDGDGDGDDDPPTLTAVTLAYGPDPAQALDLYLPQPIPSEPIPVIVLAHGGLWQSGDKLALAQLCSNLIESSRFTLACVSINYRLSHALGGQCRGAGIDTYVEQVRDFARAYALLQEQARTHGLDPARMYVGGHSAGAHLAQVLNLRWFEFEGACADGCPAPAGAIGLEGIYDVSAWDAYDAQVWNGQFTCATRRAFGGPPDSPSPCIDVQTQIPCWQIGSPTYLAEHAGALGLVPSGQVLLVHSPDDDWVDIAEVASFAAALAAGVPSLQVTSSTDGGCGSGSHDGVLGDPKLAACILEFVD